MVLKEYKLENATKIQYAVILGTLVEPLCKSSCKNYDERISSENVACQLNLDPLLFGSRLLTDLDPTVCRVPCRIFGGLRLHTFVFASQSMG